ncbi:MAG: response regulator [Candidatus Saccharimonadales bacterium]
MNVLIIESDKLLATTYARALHAVGHQPICCTNAQQAIFAADAHTPDVVLLELQLVSHSGIEFLYEFRSYPEWQDIPVIILSHVPPAEFADSWEVLSGELGVTDYLYKPHTTLVKLTETVQNLQPNLLRSARAGQ